MELKAILGAQKTIRRLNPYLYVENDRPDQSELLIEMIYNLGYKMYWHTPPLFSPANYLGNPQNIFGQIVSKNMICIHKSIQQQVDCPEVSTAGCQ